MPQPHLMITAAGQTRSLADWCRRTQLSYKKVRKRIQVLNWPPDEALEIKPRVRPNKRVVYVRVKNNKVTYQGISATIAEHCRRLGLPLPRTYNRFRYGLPLAEVFDPAPRR